MMQWWSRFSRVCDDEENRCIESLTEFSKVCCFCHLTRPSNSIHPPSGLFRSSADRRHFTCFRSLTAGCGVLRDFAGMKSDPVLRYELLSFKKTCYQSSVLQKHLKKGRNLPIFTCPTCVPICMIGINGMKKWSNSSNKKAFLIIEIAGACT